MALNKRTKPLTVIDSRLYRTDEIFMLRSSTDADEFVLYDLESTTPYYLPPDLKEFASPDTTMAMINISKISGDTSGTKLSWLDTHPHLILYGIVGAIVVYALIAGGIS